MAIATISIPDASIVEVKLNTLPENWREVPSPRVLKELAHQWIKSQESLVLKVPSIIVPQEFNYIINPFHEEFQKVILENVSSFSFDNRIL